MSRPPSPRRVPARFTPDEYEMVGRAAGHVGESLSRFCNTASVARSAFVLVKFEPVLVERWHDLYAAACAAQREAYGEETR